MESASHRQHKKEKERGEDDECCVFQQTLQVISTNWTPSAGMYAKCIQPGIDAFGTCFQTARTKTDFCHGSSKQLSEFIGEGGVLASSRVRFLAVNKTTKGTCTLSDNAAAYD